MNDEDDVEENGDEFASVATTGLFFLALIIVVVLAIIYLLI